MAATEWITAIDKRPSDRSTKDVEAITSCLRRVDTLNRLPNNVLQQLAIVGYYEDLERGVMQLSDKKYIENYRLSKQLLVKELIDALTPYMNIPKSAAGLSIKRKLFDSLLMEATNNILESTQVLL